MGESFAALRLSIVLVISPAMSSNASRVYPPDPNPLLTAGPPPVSLLGLWARGRKCGRRSWRLHITRHTMQFAGEPPLQYWYVPTLLNHFGPFLDLEEQLGHHGLDYYPGSHIIGDKGAAFGPDDWYYRCSDNFLRKIIKK